MRDHPLINKEIFKLVMWMVDPRAIEGALKSAIHAHGPIDTSGGKKLIVLKRPDLIDWEGDELYRELTTCGTSSAAKRIRGAMKTRAIEWAAEHKDLFIKSENTGHPEP